ncbi:MAG: endonuclease/exonuclease/phosphatase family protein [Pyrinomonadaceae bacterium]
MSPLDQSPLEAIQPERLEFGDITPTGSLNADSGKLIIASYNIRYAVGRYLIWSGILRKVGLNTPRHRAAAVEQNIATAARAFSDGSLLPRADILALQEADKQTGRTGGHHVARELAERLEMAWVHAPAEIPRGVPPKTRTWWLDFEEEIALNDEGDTGIALLSRFPLADVARIDLPWKECAWRPRLAMAATVRFGEKNLRLFNAHIDPHASIDGQHDQLRVLIAEAESHNGPTVIMGDFNTLSGPKCIETRRFMEDHGYRTSFPTGTATWRGAAIRLHADWIFVRGAKLGKWGVARPLNVSDHWPIWAEVEMGD